MSKHKYIETPAKLWELFETYRKEVKDNPRIKVEYVGRNGDKVNTPIERPLTIEGFKTFCAYQIENHVTIQHYWNNTDNAYDEYRTIVNRIREEIRSEQFDGALVNAYNSNLTARLNGLTDKQQIEVTETPPLFPDVPTDDSSK